MCATEGTNLASYKEAKSGDTIRKWLDGQEDSTSRYYMIGVRELWDNLYIDGPRYDPNGLTYTFSFNASCLIPHFSFQAHDSSSTAISFDSINTCSKFTDSGLAVASTCLSQGVVGGVAHYGVCEFRGCYSKNKVDMCSFPFRYIVLFNAYNYYLYMLSSILQYFIINITNMFSLPRYKGRLYDSCITLDKGFPWCASKTDADWNFISFLECSDDCEVNHCPVGFYRSYSDQSCHKVDTKLKAIQYLYNMSLCMNPYVTL